MTPRCHLASLLLPAAAVLAGLAAAQDPVAPPELGRVGWRRDLAAATAEARASDRPLLVLFQEVPG